MKDPSNIVAGDLSTPERILLFCLASGTEGESRLTQDTVESPSPLLSGRVGGSGEF
jgi:hypothetical protein